jgi:hypothetical protein
MSETRVVDSLPPLEGRDASLANVVDEQQQQQQDTRASYVTG